MKEKLSFGSSLRELFKDERGSISIKPVVGLICTLTLCSILFLNCYKSDMQLEDVLVNSVLLLAIVGIGADTVDKFSLKNGIKELENINKPKTEEPTPEKLNEEKNEEKVV